MGLTMEENTREPAALNEHVHYSHPLLRYLIRRLNVSHDKVWNKWHYHKEVEILLLLEGEMVVETVENVNRLQGPFDVLIIGSNRLHRTKRLQPVQQILFQFDMLAQLDQYTKSYSPLLMELSGPLDRLNEAMAADPDVKESFTRLLLHIYEEASGGKPGFEVSISGSMKQLLALMIRHMAQEDPMSPTDWQRLKPVLDYIEEHHADSVRIHDVLPLVHLEYHYFIKYFHQRIGMSFVEYLHLRRIKKAEHLLLTEPLSIADIGLHSG
ncbi:MAG: AraC family transcriptional regulator, partial [Paenibacillaceae bacterium]|nr:AraC family transcriptional regulator [Paenibacillaceae bacterium]